MAQILVRRIDPAAVERLRERARREGRSLEEECRQSLLASARRGGLVEAVETWRALWPAQPDEEDPFADLRQRGPGRTVELG